MNLVSQKNLNYKVAKSLTFGYCKYLCFSQLDPDPEGENNADLDPGLCSEALLTAFFTHAKLLCCSPSPIFRYLYRYLLS